MSGSVWYLSFSKKKIEFKKYPGREKSKKLKKDKSGKTKNLLIFLMLSLGIIFSLNLISAAPINDTLHLNLQTTFSNGTIEPGTFTFSFNLTESSSASCSGPVVYNHSTSLATDSRGIVSITLPTSGSGGGNLSTLSFDKQYYLCYYRDGTLKDVSQIGRVPYSFRATQVNLSEISIDSNLSLGNFNVSASSGFFSFLGSLVNRITKIFATDVDINNNLTVGGNLTVDSGTLFVDSNRNTVGIGTITPRITLVVSNTQNQFGLLDSDNPASVTTGGTLFSSNDGLFTLQGVNSTGFGSAIRFAVNQTSGNVGIGTTSPADKLTVVGTLNVTDIQLASNCADGQILKWSGGVGTCGTDDTGGGGGNPFDQVLNTTSNVTFNEVNITSIIRAGDWTNVSITESQISDFQSYILTSNEGNLNVNDSGFLDGFDSTFFMPLNKSVFGDFDFNNGWQNGGFSIVGGDIYAQTLFVYNLTSLNVTQQDLSIIDDLIVFGNTDLRKNLTVDTNTFFVDSSTGRVGIGTTSPQENLHIITGANRGFRVEDITTDLAQKAGIFVSGHYNNSEEAVMLLSSVQGSGLNVIIYGGGNANYNAATFLLFYTAADTTTVAGTERMRIDNSGRVGINTTNPQNTLNVVGDLNVTGTIFGAEGNITDTYVPYTGAFKNVDLGNNNFTVNGTTLHVDSSTGRVGIGTNSPSRTLNVVESANASTGITVDNLLNDNSSLAIITLKSATSTGSFVAVPSSYNAFGLDHLADRIVINSESTASGLDLAAVTGDIRFYSGGISTTNERMRLDSSGNLGINTTSPSDTLTVVGTLNVTDIQLASNCADGQILKWSGGVGTCGVDDTGAGGTVSGNGTTNTIPIWTGSSVLGDSRITDDGTIIAFNVSDFYINTTSGFIGIGTATPQNTLNIIGDLNFSGLIYGNGSQLTGLTESQIIDLQTYLINNTAGWTANFTNIYSLDWTNVSITESQISNLVHTTDTNETSRFNFLVNNDCSVGDLVIGIQANGTVLCATDADSGNDNIFDQILNTTSNVTFNEINVSLIRSNDWTNVSITESQISDFQSYILTSNEGNLNVNSSDFWDGLNTPSDISTGDLTDDNTYLQVAGDTGTGNFIFNQNFTVDSNTLFVDSNLNRVGIGTTSPGQALTVSGSIEAIGDVDINIAPTGSVGDTNTIGFTNQRALFGYDGGDGAVFIRGASGKHIVFDTDGANERMRITSDGNVGIGTTSPGTLLHIYNNDTSVSGGGFLVEQDGTGDAIVQYLLTGDQRWVTGIDNSDSDKFKIASSVDLNTDVRLTIDNSGNVGIGTTSPDTTLHVDGTLALERTSGVAGQNSQWNFFHTANFESSGNDNELVLEIQDEDGSFIISPAGSDGRSAITYFDSSGNVGIGTTSPGDLLEINGSNPSFKITDSNTGSLFLDADFSSAGTDRLWSDTNNLRVGTEGAKVFDIYTNNSFRVRVDSSGNVGIGTTSPTGKLHINDSTFPTLLISSEIVNNPDSGARIILSEDSAGSFGATLGYNGTAGNDRFYITTTESEEAFVIMRTTGNVGIGNNNPVTTLEVGSGVFSVNTSSGNVGIGTTSPADKLTVVGTLNVTNIQLAVNCADGQILKWSGGVGTCGTDSDAGGNISGAGTTNTISKWTSSSVLGDSLITDDGTIVAVDTSDLYINTTSGNVGIGTSSPGDKLHVSGGYIRLDNNNGIVFLNSSGLNDNTQIYRAGGNALRIEVDNNDILFRGLGIGLDILLKDENDITTGQIALQNSSDTYFNINGGNVGIGTASPDQELHIRSSGGTPGIKLEDGGNDGWQWVMGADDLTMSTTGGGAGNVMFWNYSSGNVGIGTTSPGTKLSFGSNSVISRDTDDGSDSGVLELSGGGAALNTRGSYITLFGNEFGGREGELVLSAGNNGVNSTIRFSSGGSERVRITSSGNVGIGTNSPTGKLHVFTDIDITANPDTKGIRLDESAGQWLLSLGISGVTNTGFAIRDVAAGTYPLVIRETTGNVGIGTTSPDHKLNVQGAAAGSETIISIDADDGGRVISMGKDSTDDGFIEINDGSQNVDIKFNTDGDSWFNGGNVGIGTTSPGHNLQIGDGTNEALSVAFKGNVANTQSFVWEAEDATDRFTQYANLDASTANDLLIFRSLNNDNILVLKGGGNVGIGTTSPTAKLDIEGDIVLGGTDRNITFNDQFGLDHIFMDSTAADLQISSRGDVEIILDANSNDADAEFRVFNNSDSGTQVFTIEGTSGNVGIGTDNPVSLLNVQGTSDIVQFRLEGFSTQTASIFLIENSTGTDQIRMGADGSAVFNDDGNSVDFRVEGNTEVNLFVVDGSADRVGIGTSSPGDRFEVKSSGANTNPISAVASDDQQIFRVREGSGGDGLVSIYDTSGNEDFRFFAAGDSWLNGGNVGIGTTSPNQKLHIFDADESLALKIDTTGNNDAAYIQNPFESSNGFVRAVFSGNLYWDGVSDVWRYGASGSNGLGAVLVDGNAGLKFITRASNGSTEGSFTDATLDASYTRMVIREDGNVGIGLTGPSNRLEVNGSIETDGLLDTDATNFFDGSCTFGVASIDSTGALTCATQQGTGSMSSWTIAGDTGSTAVSDGETVTIAGSGTIDTSESTRTVTVSVQADSIGDTQLAFNTGQTLTTSGTPTFSTLTLTGTGTALTSAGDILLTGSGDVIDFSDDLADKIYLHGTDFKIGVESGRGTVISAGDIVTARGDTGGFQVLDSSSVQKFLVDTSGNVQMDGDLTVSGGNVGIGVAPDLNYSLRTAGDILITGGDILFTDNGVSNRDHISYNDSSFRTSAGTFVFHADTSLGTATFSPTAAISAEDAYFSGDLNVDGGDIFDAGTTPWLEVSGCGANTGVSSVNSAGTITCTADSASDNYGSWTIAADSGTETVSSGQTATIAGSGTIDTIESGTRTVVVSVQADSIGDTQLAFNTGQALTTSSNVQFDAFSIGTSATSLNGTNTNGYIDVDADEYGLVIEAGFDSPDEPARLLITTDADGTDDIAIEVRGESSGTLIHNPTWGTGVSSTSSRFVVFGNGNTVIGKTSVGDGYGMTQSSMLEVNGLIYASGDVDVGGGDILDDGANFFGTSGCGANTGVSSMSSAGTITCTADSASDNYGDWDLFTDGVERDSITTAEDVGFDSGTGVNVVWDGSRDVGFSFDCSDVEGTGINCVGESVTLDATGDWTGTLDGFNGAQFLRSDASDTTTGSLTVNGVVLTDGIRDRTGQQFVINAGESEGVATGQTSEYIYLNAESGIQVVSSPDNWGSGWAGRDTTLISGTAITVDGNTVHHAGNDPLDTIAEWDSLCTDCVGNDDLAANSVDLTSDALSTAYAGSGLGGGGIAALNVGAGSCVTIGANDVGVTGNCVNAATTDGFSLGETMGNCAAGDVHKGNGACEAESSLSVSSASTASDLVCTNCIGATEIADGLGASEISDIYLFNNGDTMSGTLTMTASISMGNNNINNANLISINDPGEGIDFLGGSSGTIVFEVVDDATDNIMRLSGSSSNTFVLDLTNSGAGNFNIDMNQNDILDVDHIDANFYDPPYTIAGNRYATFLPGMTGGVKEQATGTVMLNSSYTIDFKSFERGSELWLFYQITDFGEHMENLQVMLTPSFDGRVWYTKNPEEKTITIHGSAAGEVSYRFTSNRFDWRTVVNYKPKSPGLIIPEEK